MKRPILPVVLLACSALLAACATTPPAVSALMQQVTQACQSGKQGDLKACYATDGVKPDQIDQQLGGWDAYFGNAGSAYAWTFSSIRYESLADAANDKSILPLTLAMAQPSSASGMATAPNIKVIGFILVMFKQANGSQGGETEYVGIASDGTAKFALVEPQK
jgi:curli biogenesis system outer membrane secretion channel CsgG